MSNNVLVRDYAKDHFSNVECTLSSMETYIVKNPDGVNPNISLYNNVNYMRYLEAALMDSFLYLNDCLGGSINNFQYHPIQRKHDPPEDIGRIIQIIRTKLEVLGCCEYKKDELVPYYYGRVQIELEYEIGRAHV